MLFACAAEPVPVKDCVVPPWSLSSLTPSLKNNFPIIEEGPNKASGKSNA